MGRPLKSEDNKRSIKLFVRLTKSEKELLDNKIKGTTISLPDYVRQAVFNKEVVVKRIVSPAFKMDIGKIGNNLNQIARLFNTNPEKYKISQREFRMMEEMKELLNEIKNKL